MRIFEWPGAQALEFDDGRCVVAWLGDHPSLSCYQKVEDMFAVHGHDRVITQVADIDLDEARRLYGNWVQDLCENVVATLPEGNARYMAREHGRLVAMFEARGVGR